MQKLLNLTENFLFFIDLILTLRSVGPLISAAKCQWRLEKGNGSLYSQPGHRFLVTHHVETPVLVLALNQYDLATSEATNGNLTDLHSVWSQCAYAGPLPRHL